MTDAGGLRVTNLSKHFGETAALVDVSLSVAPGEVHALLGGNGSGKSTLIKILAGVEPADPGGRIAVAGRVVAAEEASAAWARSSGLSFVHQDLGLFDVMTVAENLFAGQEYPRRRGRIDWGAMRRSAQHTLDALGIGLCADRALATLRPADRTLVAIARALHGREDFHDGVLVLDEPTARLPDAEVTLLMESLHRHAEQGQTILYVSHRLEEVFALAKNITVLRDGRVVASRPVAGLGEQDLIGLIVGRTLAASRHLPARRSSSAPVAELRHVHAGPLRDISLAIEPSEVIGVAGLVGSGRTTLLEAIYGAVPISDGELWIAGDLRTGHTIRSAIKAGLSYVPEDRAAQGAFLSLGIPENLSAADPGRFVHGMRLRYGEERRAAAQAITRFGIRTAAVSAPMSSLSGGNQQKVVVARWLQLAPRLLLLDEPTQGVDVGARADIYAQLQAAILAGAAAIVVSSDFDELLLLADRIVVLTGGRITATALAPAIDRNWLGQHVYAQPQEVLA